MLNPDSIKDTIARGVETGMLGYVGKNPDGSYFPFHWKSSLLLLDVELSDETYIIQKETAEAYVAARAAPAPLTPGPQPPIGGPFTNPPTVTPPHTSQPPADPPTTTLSRVTWQGDVPPQKWMNFYTKVLSKFVTESGLKVGLKVEIAPQDGVSPQKVDAIKVALRELGLSDEISVDE